jgi:hypothetical protein
MSHIYSPIQFYSLLKSCMIFFVVQAVVVVLFFSSIWVSPPLYRIVMFLINIAISVFLGWRLYKQRYHLILSYDNKGFTLKQGRKEEISHEWSEFSGVSLIRTEQGDFSIRLSTNGDPFDLPASKFKLDPFGFRWDVTKLVEASRKEKGP